MNYCVAWAYLLALRVACDIYTKWLWPDKETDWVVCHCSWVLGRKQILMLRLFQVQIMCSAQYHYFVIGALRKRRFMEITIFTRMPTRKDVITRAAVKSSIEEAIWKAEGETICVLDMKGKAHICWRINDLISFKDQYLMAGLVASYKHQLTSFQNNEALRKSTNGLLLLMRICIIKGHRKKKLFSMASSDDKSRVLFFVFIFQQNASFSIFPTISNII